MMYVEILIIILLGTLFHFTYELSGHNKIVGIFTAVNESTWEHIKIALTATLLASIVDGFILGQNPNYIFAKFISLLVIIILIPIIFYTYTFFTKKSILLIDILIFCVAIFVSNITFYKLLSIPKLPFVYTYFGMIGISIVLVFYLLLTLLPPKNILFRDPITKNYGEKGHSDSHNHKH